MSKSERESIFASCRRTRNGWKELFDLMTIADGRNEPVRPIDEVFSDLKIDVCVAHSLCDTPKNWQSFSEPAAIGRAIRALEHDPVPASAKRLKGREEFRLRVGDYGFSIFSITKITF